MILSASRRTDIPAWGGEAFLAGLDRGWFEVANPRHPAQVRRVVVTPETVDAVVFWTKNPAPLLTRLDELERLGYHRYCFLFTLNGYGPEVEPGVPPLAVRLETFRVLSERIGRERLVWRYDPILFSAHYDEMFHCSCFAFLAEQLAPCCRSCTISFLDFYRKCRVRLAGAGVFDPPDEAKLRLARQLSAIGRRYGLRLFSCAEALDLEEAGIGHGSCIDPVLLASMGCPGPWRRDRNQREMCGCAASVDIGSYGSCRSGCIYCYAS